MSVPAIEKCQKCESTKGSLSALPADAPGHVRRCVNCGHLSANVTADPAGDVETFRKAYFDLVKWAMRKTADGALDRIAVLEALCGEAYQAAAALNAPVPLLDKLAAAANGDEVPR